MQKQSQAGANDSNARAPRPQGQSKLGKKQKNLYLSTQARQLLSTLSYRLGISETAVAELLIREKAARENITVSLEEGAPDDS